MFESDVFTGVLIARAHVALEIILPVLVYRGVSTRVEPSQEVDRYLCHAHSLGPRHRTITDTSVGSRKFI